MSLPISRARSALRAVVAAAWLVVLAAAPSPAIAVDANTASADELQTIRGIGPATAALIIEARQREPFRDLDDLRERVRGIGEKKLHKMRDAGLEVFSGGHVVETLGRARVLDAGAARRGAAAGGTIVDAPRRGSTRRVEHYVGHPR